MEEGLGDRSAGPGSTGPDPAAAGPVLKPAVVEEVRRRLAQREQGGHLAAEFGADPKTIRARPILGRIHPAADAAPASPALRARASRPGARSRRGCVSITL